MNTPFIVLTESQLRKVIREEMSANRSQKPEVFDKITQTEAAKLVGVTTPTFRKMVKQGKFKEYNTGRRKHYFREEIIAALRREADEKERQ